MTTLTLRAIQRDITICAVLMAAPLHRGRILRGLAAPMLHRWNMILHAGQSPSAVARQGVGPMSRLRKPICWWEPMLPAGAWLYAASLLLQFARTLMRSGLYWRRGLFVAMRLSGRLSRAGFNSWRFWGGKWR